jgi:hypothetical protein
MSQVFMRDADPNGGFQQHKYFTDQNADFDNVKTKLKRYSDKSQNDEFSLLQQQLLFNRYSY